MQSYFSNKTQPYPLAGYPIFVAEVASTFNESLLIDYMLSTIKDDDTRLSLLGNYLENIKGTVFRQTQFAEFELRMHEMARKGSRSPATRSQALHGHHEDVLRPRSGRLRRRRLHRARVELHPALLSRLLRVPVRDVVHGVAALAEKVKTAIRRRAALPGVPAAGGSKYPIDLLKDAGVDMTTDEPLDLTIKAMNQVMDEIEALLAKRK
jgi:oligoendopeptidase F